MLYRWRSIPSAENLNGTVARPTARHAWSAIEKSLQKGDNAGDAAHDENPEIDTAPPPRIIFLAALIANGWFVRVKSFAFSPGVRSVPARFALALSRWLLFLVFWVAALLFLPSALVGLAFGCWVIWIARDIKRTLGGLDAPVELKADR